MRVSPFHPVKNIRARAIPRLPPVTLPEMSAQNYVSSFDTAIIFAGLQDVEQTLLWLEKAYNERSVLMPFLKCNSYLDALRSDSRFDDWRRRVGFEKI